MVKSRTIFYQQIKGVVGTAVIGMAAFADIMDPMTFGITMLCLNILDSLISTYLRTITTKPLDEK